MDTYEERKNELLNRWGTSKWLKEQILVSEGRAVVDMLNDIEELQGLLLRKWANPAPPIKEEREET